MNRKVITVTAIIVVAVLCIVAIIYAPNLMELMLRIHKIPQH